MYVYTRRDRERERDLVTRGNEAVGASKSPCIVLVPIEYHVIIYDTATTHCNDTLQHILLHHTTTHYRMAEIHRMPYLYRSWFAKEPCNSWLFCEKRPAT